MLRFDLSRPDIVYGLIWGTALVLIQTVQMGFIYEMQPAVLTLIVANIASFWLIYTLMSYLPETKRGTKVFELPELDIYCLKRFSWALFKIWLPLYLLTILLSGGIPVLWILTGDGRTYLDFGVSTLSGFLNMTRAFIFSACLLVYLNTRKRNVLLLPLIMLLAGLAEVSRGNLTVMLLHGVGMYLLYTRNTFRVLAFTMIFGTVFIYMFGIMAEFRGGAMPAENFVGDDNFFLMLPSGFFWVYTYLVSPLNNINYAYLQGIEPLMYPYYSIQPMVPTVVRNMLFPDNVYPIQLANEAFNATTYYSPLIADFGIVFAGLVVVLLQSMVAYFHVKAQRGHIFHILVFPALFMCVVMSVFYMFFFSMVVILYPVVALFYMRYRNTLRNTKTRAENRMDNALPSAG